MVLELDRMPKKSKRVTGLAFAIAVAIAWEMADQFPSSGIISMLSAGSVLKNKTPLPSRSTTTHSSGTKAEW